MPVRVITVCCLVVLGNPSGQLLAQSTGIRDITDEVSTNERRSVPGTVTTKSGNTKLAGKQASPDGNGSQQQKAVESAVLQQRHESDSLRLMLGMQSLKVPADSLSRHRYESAVDVAWKSMIVWFVLVLLYLVWAIHRYVYNYGLSNREWKVRYPEVYVTSIDRLNFRVFGRMLGLKTFEERREDLVEYKIKLLTRQKQLNDEDLDPVPAIQATKLLDEPEKNPYERDSFGLPPGTIRGILALSALAMFLLVEGVNLYAPGNLENQFDGLVTALEMVLAFYFGSRAVEVLQAKASESVSKREPVPAGTGPVPMETTASESVLPSPSQFAPEGVLEGPTEEAVLPASNAQARFANFVVLARDEKSPAQPKPFSGLTSQTTLATRVLALTASFETGRAFPDCFAGISGNFDKQGLSFGALQWNIGQGSLQPLWIEMKKKHEKEMTSAFGDLFDDFSRMLDSTKDEQMRWALSIQRLVSTSKNAWEIFPNWKSALRALGTKDGMIDIQVKHASSIFQSALGSCRDYGLTTDRGTALMFDIRVQNGSVDRGGAGAKIRADFDLINPVLSDDEKQVERMRIIARRRSEVSSAQWRNDVLTRKLTIAEGKGTVHGRGYDLDKDFTLNLKPFMTDGSSTTDVKNV